MDILDILLVILLKPPQPFIGLFLELKWMTKMTNRQNDKQTMVRLK